MVYEFEKIEKTDAGLSVLFAWVAENGSRRDLSVSLQEAMTAKFPEAPQVKETEWKKIAAMVIAHDYGVPETAPAQKLA